MDDKKVDRIISLLERIAEGQERLYTLMSKYDSQYLVEVEQDGNSREG